MAVRRSLNYLGREEGSVGDGDVPDPLTDEELVEALILGLGDVTTNRTSQARCHMLL